jgi:TPR repeat protein
LPRNFGKFISKIFTLQNKFFQKGSHGDEQNHQLDEHPAFFAVTCAYAANTQPSKTDSLTSLPVSQQSPEQIQKQAQKGDAGVKIDSALSNRYLAEAFSILQKQADDQYAPGQFYLGVMYANGEASPVDQAKTAN